MNATPILCPQCSAKLMIAIPSQSQVKVRCPKCQHLFSTRIDLPTSPEFVEARIFPSEKVRSTDPITVDSMIDLDGKNDLRPKADLSIESAQFVEARIAVEPSGAIPPAMVPSRSAAPPQQVSIPKYDSRGVPSSSDPLWDSSLSTFVGDPLSTPPRYVTIKKKPPFQVPYRLIAIVGSVAGCLLLVLLGGYLLVRVGNSMGLRVLPDTHESLFEECIQDLEANLAKSQKNFQSDQGIDKEVARMPALRRRTDQQLRRAVLLGATSKEKVDEFQQRIQQSMFRFAQSNPSLPVSSSKERIENYEKIEAISKEYRDVTIALASYLGSGICELSPPSSEIQVIYYNENAVVRQYLKVLCNQDSPGSKLAQMETLTDDLMTLVQSRSTYRAGIDSLPPDYVSIDRSLGLVHTYLTSQLTSKYPKNIELLDADDHFNVARSLLISASRGKRFEELQDTLANARASTRPVIVSGPSSPKVSSPKVDARPKVSGPPPSTYDGTSSSSPYPPGFKLPERQDRPSSAPGMQGERGYVGEPSMSQTMPSRPGVGASGGTNGQPGMIGEPGMSPIEPEPNRGAPPTRPGLAGAPGTAGEPGMLGNMQGNASGQGNSKSMVHIEISGKKKVSEKSVAKLIKELKIVSFQYRTQGKLSIIDLSYDGPLSDIMEKIDFGSVTSMDEESRTITVLSK